MDEVGKYIEKQKSPQKDIIRKVRKIILKTFPKINEAMRVGVPCYGHTEKEPCGKFYLVALRDHVNLGFSLKGLSKEEQKFFEGSGKTMKHISIRSVKEVDEKRIVWLLKIVGSKR